MDKAPAGLLGAGEEASEPGRFGCWDSLNSPKCIQEKAKLKAMNGISKLGTLHLLRHAQTVFLSVLSPDPKQNLRQI